MQQGFYISNLSRWNILNTIVANFFIFLINLHSLLTVNHCYVTLQARLPKKICILKQTSMLLQMLFQAQKKLYGVLVFN